MRYELQLLQGSMRLVLALALATSFIVVGCGDDTDEMDADVTTDASSDTSEDSQDSATEDAEVDGDDTDGEADAAETDAGESDANGEDGGQNDAQPDAEPDGGSDADSSDADETDAEPDAGETDGGDDAATDATMDGEVDGDVPGEITDIEMSMPDGMPIAPSTECVITTSRQPSATATHMDPCTDLEIPHMPPSSGPHYRFWANFVEYSEPVPWGFLIHSMEHGAVVLAYNCPEGCDDVLTALRDIKSTVEDERCDEIDGLDNRVLIVPMPDLPTPLAALAWEHRYEATCLDRESLDAFVEANYAMAPENFCNRGMDLETEGWCE